MPTLHTYALTTLANIKEALGITDNTQNDYLTNLINRSTDIIEKYCGRRFLSTIYTNEIYDGTGTRYLNLDNYPITAISKLELMTGDFATPNWDTVETDIYTYKGAEGQVYHSGGFQEGVQNYRISYTAGYTTIPTDLEQACITLISYLKNQTKTSGMKSESLGEYSYTKDDDVRATIKTLGLDEILDAYRTPTV